MMGIICADSGALPDRIVPHVRLYTSLTSRKGEHPRAARASTPVHPTSNKSARIQTSLQRRSRRRPSLREINHHVRRERPQQTLICPLIHEFGKSAGEGEDRASGSSRTNQNDLACSALIGRCPSHGPHSPIPRCAPSARAYLPPIGEGHLSAQTLPRTPSRNLGARTCALSQSRRPKAGDSD
ncbi:uncharacterized protein LAESUDRAFT_38639 [Laetiporus sulphureus 93-53]|uniref:Uncharacterized protein n=1 Tax=Laetiporus sulphureus 93-53 TaxID=1314785 RepID=A0A165IML6_9APHY|nr:uncharacterized protein LAESUDRAFT_38639 [Laetiporus sulphureus 93-53]KZT13288.1 hypothetical protein LAESUDRAFT_38639 [Laetiporus sulphureus 93-53]